MKALIMNWELSDFKYRRDSNKMLRQLDVELREAYMSAANRGILNSSIFNGNVVNIIAAALNEILTLRIQYDFEVYALSNTPITRADTEIFYERITSALEALSQHAIPSKINNLRRNARPEFLCIEDDIQKRTNVVQARIQGIIWEKVLENELTSYGKIPSLPDISFDFINDQLFRQRVNSELDELTDNIKNCNKRSVVERCGSIAETVLLDLMLSDEQRALSSTIKTSKPIRRWGLDDLSNVALNLQLINNECYQLIELLRSYRNTIHPGQELRTGISVTIEQAIISTQALIILIRALSPVSDLSGRV